MEHKATWVAVLFAIAALSAGTAATWQRDRASSLLHPLPHTHAAVRPDPVRR